MNDLETEWGAVAVAIAVIVSFLGIFIFACVYHLPEYMQQPSIDLLFFMSGLVSLVVGDFFKALSRVFKKICSNS